MKYTANNKRYDKMKYNRCGNSGFAATRNIPGIMAQLRRNRCI